MTALSELKKFLKLKGLTKSDLKQVNELVKRTKIATKNKEIKNIHEKTEEERNIYLKKKRTDQFTIKHKKFKEEANKKMEESKKLREIDIEKIKNLNVKMDRMNRNNSYQYTMIMFINPDDEINKTGEKLVAPRNGKKKDSTVRRQRYVLHKGITYQQVAIVNGTYANPIDPSLYLKYLSVQSETSDFKKIIKNVLLDSDVKKEYNKIDLSKRVSMIYVYDEIVLKSIVKNKVDADDQLKKRVFKKLFDDINLGDSKLMNPYINYELNKEADTFGDLFYGDYLIDNKKANSCYINLILNTYYDQFEKKRTSGQRYYKNELSYDILCNIMKIQNLNTDLGLSIIESVAFFKKFKLGLDCMDIFGNLIYRFRPEGELNQLLSPHVLRIVIYNNHVYKANKKTQQIGHIKDDDMEDTLDEIKNIKLSNKYYIRDTTKTDDTLTVFVESFED